MNVKAASKKVTTRPAAPVEDDERHTTELNDYVTRNRRALNASLDQARAEFAAGKVSKKSVKDIIAEGRRRHAAKS